MAIAVIMPKQGQSVETCIITKWFKKKGEHVASGDILFSYETDKASFDLESPADGILLDSFFEEGSEVPVLVNVAVIGTPGEDISLFNPGNQTLPGSLSDTETDPGSANDVKANVKSGIDGSHEGNVKIRISPRAKRLAEEKGLDYKKISGSGPNGRILSDDIEKALSDTLISNDIITPGNEYSEKSLSNVRKLIAEAMHSSLQNSAQLTHHMSADVRLLLEARQKIKTKIAENRNQHDITLNDMICWCVIRALEKFPEINSHFLGDSIRTFSKVHLGLAVDTPRGLMVPVVKNASDMDLKKLSVELKSVADACRKGNVNPEILRSTAATFTVSNLGNYGVEMFTPVINLPQAGILGVCSIINRPADLGNHTFGFIPVIGLSLTYDHRAIDGGPATLFLREIKTQIEGFREGE